MVRHIARLSGKYGGPYLDMGRFSRSATCQGRERRIEAASGYQVSGHGF